MWRLARQSIESAVEQIKNTRNRRLRFGRLLDQLNKISRLLKRTEVPSQCGMKILHDHFAQQMQLGAVAALKSEFGEIEQIELSAERRFSAACAFG